MGMGRNCGTHIAHTHRAMSNFHTQRALPIVIHITSITRGLVLGSMNIHIYVSVASMHMYTIFKYKKGRNRCLDKGTRRPFRVL